MTTILVGNVADHVVDILVACLMLMGAFLVLGLGLWYYRRWQRNIDPGPAMTWTLEDLRKLRSQGELTEAEYQTLRAGIIGGLTDEKASQGPPRNFGASVETTRSQEGVDEEWDWVAEDEPGSENFDVKK